MWISSGPLHSGDSYPDMLGDGTSMVRRSDGPLHKSREFLEAGI